MTQMHYFDRNPKINRNRNKLEKTLEQNNEDLMDHSHVIKIIDIMAKESKGKYCLSIQDENYLRQTCAPNFLEQLTNAYNLDGDEKNLERFVRDLIIKYETTKTIENKIKQSKQEFYKECKANRYSKTLL